MLQHQENGNDFLVLINGEIKQDVETCQQKENGQFSITFKNNTKKYTYSASKVQYFDNPIAVKFQDYEFVLTASNTKLFNIEKVLCFNNQFYKVFFPTKIRIYKDKDLAITKDALANASSKNILDYFKHIAVISHEHAQNGDSKTIAKNIRTQYERLDFIDPQTIAAKYLNPDQEHEKIVRKETIIFPFGCNASQMVAVEKAVNNPVSIIEGPPGTGKTQTILNIIANALMDKKSIAIVSNNNSATDNVFEKLEKHNFSYLAAQLGKRENRDLFFENKQCAYPSFEDDFLEKEDVTRHEQAIVTLRNELSTMLEKQNRNAVLLSELADLALEQKYFDEYFESEEHKSIEIFAKKRNLSLRKTQTLFAEIQASIENKNNFSLWFKLKAYFYYGITSFAVFKEDKAALAANIQKMFYTLKSNEINAEIQRNEKALKSFCFEDKLQEFTNTSILLLKAALAHRYNKPEARTRFSEEIRRKPQDFIQEYPIVLSSTHAIKNSLPGFMYDYLIVDEASQVGLLTAFLALSCAKRVVIVGDVKQLPNVIDSHLKKLFAQCSTTHTVSENYRIESHSLLSSASSLFSDVPKTLLKEHYRCHPKIIDFCNKRFYNNQLVIMSKDKGEDDVLKVIITSSGNHARGNVNYRQIDEIKHSVLPVLHSNNVGIISPYRKQAEELKKVFPEIPSATVHKFQGRENDDIIITTVDNAISEFTDNPNLLNVAVSRAKNRLVIIVSDNEKNDNTNIGALVNYIHYNSLTVIHSDLYSVFDLLYKANAAARKEFLKKAKKVSEYDSENIMYATLEEVLAIERFSHFSIGVHIPLHTIIRNLDKIKADTKKYNYAKNPATHVDFLIYNTVDKRPLLAIEVDGHSFHNETTKQSHRDKLKDEIFSLFGLPLKRFSTTGSMEVERLIAVLDTL